MSATAAAPCRAANAAVGDRAGAAAHPSLLILDEATAALDADSESDLLRRLRALDPRPAALVIAHRVSTLAHCDSVLSIQHGIAEKSGDPSRLEVEARQAGFTRRGTGTMRSRVNCERAKKALVLGRVAIIAAAGFATVAMAQQDRSTPKGWSYEIKDGKRVPGQPREQFDGQLARDCAPGQLRDDQGKVRVRRV